MNTTEFLTIATAIVPDRTAIVHEGRRFSYEEMQERVWTGLPTPSPALA